MIHLPSLPPRTRCELAQYHKAMWTLVQKGKDILEYFFVLFDLFDQFWRFFEIKLSFSDHSVLIFHIVRPEIGLSHSHPMPATKDFFPSLPRSLSIPESELSSAPACCLGTPNRCLPGSSSQWFSRAVFIIYLTVSSG